MKKISVLLALVSMLSSVTLTSFADTATSAKLTITAPTSMEVGKPQDLTVKLTAGGNQIDAIVLAGTYSADVADISFSAVSSADVPKGFTIQKPTISSGVFSLSFSSMTDAISKDADILKITVTPKKAGNFSLKLTQGGEQGTQILLANTATNILDKTSGVTPTSTDITVVGDNSNVTSSTATPVVENVPVATENTTMDSNTGATTDATTTTAVPKSGPAETFLIMALVLGLLSYGLHRKFKSV